ncbi:MAG: hypothetical protein ACXVGQ_14690 [Mycobacteriaceae bacterium]
MADTDPAKEETLLAVIACAGVLGWLLMLGVTLCLGAAAKRGDKLASDVQRHPPPYCVDDVRITASGHPEPVAGSRTPRKFCRPRRYG